MAPAEPSLAAAEPTGCERAEDIEEPITPMRAPSASASTTRIVLVDGVDGSLLGVCPRRGGRQSDRALCGCDIDIEAEDHIVPNRSVD